MQQGPQEHKGRLQVRAHMGEEREVRGAEGRDRPQAHGRGCPDARDEIACPNADISRTCHFHGVTIMENSTVSSAEVMKKHKVIAVVGASKNPTKEAHIVPLYLKGNGYRIVPINPSADEILGEKAYPSLLDLPDSLAKE